MGVTEYVITSEDTSSRVLWVMRRCDDEGCRAGRLKRAVFKKYRQNYSLMCIIVGKHENERNRERNFRDADLCRK